MSASISCLRLGEKRDQFLLGMLSLVGVKRLIGEGLDGGSFDVMMLMLVGGVSFW